MKPDIHPTSIIDENAKIGAGSKIGPWVVIDGEVELGNECEVRSKAVLTGRTKIGDRCQIGHGAIIGTEAQDAFAKGKPGVVDIGADNIIREYVTIHCASNEEKVTQIGNHNFFMVGCHVAHDCVVGDHVFLVNNVLLGGYVEIGDHAFLGGASVVHQFTRIGKYVMVRGHTRLGLDVPPFCMAVDTNTVYGLNRVGLKRNGIDAARRRLIQRAYHLLYHCGYNRTQAIEAMKNDPELQNDDIRDFIDFLLSTTRGLSQPVPKEVSTKDK